MLSFFRLRRARGPVDFAIGMTGVRLGERLVQIGPGIPSVFAASAAKAGLTGRACAVVADRRAAAALEAAAAREGVYVEVTCAPAGQWPYEAAAFDVAVLDGNLILAAEPDRREPLMRAAHQIVRPGGRAIAIYRRPRGLASRLGFEPTRTSDDAADALVALFGQAGFGPVRFLASREGLTFVEAFRPAAR